MKARTHVSLGGIVALTLVVSAVYAQPPGGGFGRGGRGNFDPEQFFQRMDQNGDGAVTRDEFRGPDDAFARMDSDGDGKATLEEFNSNMRNRRGGDDGQTDWRARGLSMWKDRLGATDEEWTVLEPRLQNVMEIRASLNQSPGFRRGGFGGGPGAVGQQEAMPEAERLRDVVDNEASTQEEIQAALKAYREAREKKETELKKAQEELRSVVTVRQEGMLVMADLLN